MTQSTINFEKKSTLLTIIILIASATLGAFGAIIIALPAAISAVALTGPIGWLTVMPILLTAASLSLAWVLIGVPIWALIGGYLFADLDCGKPSRAASAMNVKFFSEDHDIYKKVQILAKQLNLPTIAHVGWFPNENINAFAMGQSQDNALLAFSQGAIEKLTKDQFDAVIAHELGHVANNDMERMTIARGIQGSLTWFLLFRGLKKTARWIFTPVSELEILRFSRAREFSADNIAAQLVSPDAIIGVLQRLEDEKPNQQKSNDLDLVKFSASFNSKYMSTHPPLNERIKAVQQIKVALAQAERPKEHEVVKVEPTTEPEPAEIELIPTYKPWASAGLMSFGS